MGGRGSYSNISAKTTLSFNDFDKIKSGLGGLIEVAGDDEIQIGKTLGLNEFETNLIYSYTDRMYFQLNQKLYKEENGVINFTKEKLNNSLDKLNSYKGTVYRGMNVKNVNKFILGLEKSKTFKFDTFTSTSQNSERAMRFLEGKGKILFNIKSKSGKSVRNIAIQKNEEEVLFKAGSKFRFMSKSFKNGIHYINIKEI